MDFGPCRLVAFFHDVVFIKKHEDLGQKDNQSIIITEPQRIKKRNKTKQNKHILMYSGISIFWYFALTTKK